MHQVARVVSQLKARPYYLYLYLDALFDKDPHLASDYADNQMELYAEFAPRRLIDFLRASNYYSLEKVRLASFIIEKYLITHSGLCRL